MATREDEYKRLRAYLNKAIRGANTDAILKSVASGPAHLINNVEAVNDSLYVVSAQEMFLDQRLGDKGVIRPPNVGLSDEAFREIGIEVTTRKQVRDLIHQLLRVLYGEVFTRATSDATEVENYFLEDGDNLLISFDGGEPLDIIFSTSQFQNISSATAQEVADAITKKIRELGQTGSAFVKEQGNDFKVSLISSTDGPSSSVRVLGGKAQNVLKFEEIRPTSGDFSTQWTITQEPDGSIRFTWTGGANPSIGKVKPGDYVNIYGTAFDTLNRGTFIITEVISSTVNNSYFEIQNPNGLEEIVTQGTGEAVLFFNPKLRTLISDKRYAAAFQTSPRTLEVFMPATTRIVRRSRKGAAHIYESGPSLEGQEGPYIYDETVGYTISNESASTTEILDTDSDDIVFVDDASEFPDEAGSVIIGLGTSHQEGPVPYIAKPSSNTIRIDPSYKFKNRHPIGTDIALVAEKNPPNVSLDGNDYPFYLTDSVAGRLYAEDLIKEVVATGIIVIIYILYPSDEGLGNWGNESTSEKFYVWGTEEDLIG